MIAGSLSFSERLNPASAVAFGNVLDLARFRQGGAGGGGLRGLQHHQPGRREILQRLYRQAAGVLCGCGAW